MSENTIADLLRQLDSEEGAIADCNVIPMGTSESWNITVTRPEAVVRGADRIVEPLSEGDCLSYLYHLIGTIEAGERRISLLQFDCPEVETTKPEDDFRHYAPTGVVVWTFTVEPVAGPATFTRQSPSVPLRPTG